MIRKRFLNVDDLNNINTSVSTLSSRISSAESALSQKADLSVITPLANRVTTNENKIGSLETWRSNKRPYMGRLNTAMTGLSLTVLGLSVAGSGLIDRVSEIITYINTKVAPALEAKEITATA